MAYEMNFLVKFFDPRPCGCPLGANFQKIFIFHPIFTKFGQWVQSTHENFNSKELTPKKYSHEKNFYHKLPLFRVILKFKKKIHFPPVFTKFGQKDPHCI